MTKAQFLAALSSNYPVIVQIDSVVHKVHDITVQDVLYSVNVRKIEGDKVNYENIMFVVVKEGLPAEAAYFYKRNTITFLNTQEADPVV